MRLILAIITSELCHVPSSSDELLRALPFSDLTRKTQVTIRGPAGHHLIPMRGPIDSRTSERACEPRAERKAGHLLAYYRTTCTAAYVCDTELGSRLCTRAGP